MEMEKSYYLITYKPSYLALLRSHHSASESEPRLNRAVIAITQGGFAQDVIDEERQAKERFLEYLFSSSGIDLPRSAEVFDQYFELEPIAEFIDLDEEVL
jgi:hypothetical protein